ncbi:type I restriction enzyme specificity protein (plasmid) [Leuconostoc kimchii IMSNU 11154]|uniref:Type I restriction enzyme specificity protein n=1 Tax=Leuconostoc kimchii (strain IMSNU 11154 / KCTC 2386 / IH25) TaxID=762051 RepID=D5SZQ3_LEUKI|nr:restriction endonuclease subunit S [Leuconostoc kimchii]ADG39502.1 type I restriction enzyme specificity protein [Leuconostoc kimchii IMSNU 11154]
MSNKVPQIRFNGYSDTWEERKLGDLLKEFSIKSKIEDEHKVLSSTNSGMEFREGRVSGTSNLGYKIIKNGDLVLSPQNLWLGNININNIGKGLVSPSYKTFEFINIDSSFINPQLRTQKMLEEYKNSSTQGASVVRRNLEIDSFYQIKIFVPTISEQEKIGSFFKQLDNTIDLHQRKLDLLKEQKKGFLQKMFPKNGEKVPELRFAGFADDWEERKLGDLLKEFSIKSKIEDEHKVLSSTNSGMEFREGRVSGTSNLGYKIIKNGDLVLSPQNLWLGNININNIGKGLVSPSYKTFEFINIDSSFINPQLRTQKMLEEYKNSSTQGASVVRRNLEIDSFYQIKIFVPTISEQEKIGSFFKQLDNTIDLHQRKLDLLKEQKKGFLQKMFV